MDTRSLQIVRTHRVALDGDDDGARTSAVVSAAGGTIFIGSAADGQAVHAFATDTFDPLARWSTPSAVRDLGLSADGGWLYAALDDGIALLDPADGSIVDQVGIGGADRILRVLPAGD
jgi:hypothetical protein